MKVTNGPIGNVKPFEKSPRNNDAAVDSVANSIKSFGLRQPLVVDCGGTIIAGHTRWKAALKLGLTQVPVHIAEELSPEQVRALRIADYKLHELSTWNEEILAIELGELKELDVDLGLLGFSDDDLTAIFAPTVIVGLVDEDDVPEPPDAATPRRATACGIWFSLSVTARDIRDLSQAMPNEGREDMLTRTADWPACVRPTSSIVLGCI